MVIETWFSQDVKKPVQVHYIDGNVFSQDNSGNLIGVLLMDGDDEVTVSGTVSANVIRSDGTTVAVSGTKSGNKAQVVLPQSAYAVPGLISVIIKTTDSGAVTTLCAVVGNVYQSTTDTVVDPGTIIPSVQTLIASIEAAVSSIPADYSSLWTSLAPAYSSDSTYNAGDYVTYDGKLYVCGVNITTAESWTAAHWSETSAAYGLKSFIPIQKSVYYGTNQFNGHGVIPFIAGYYTTSDNPTTNGNYTRTPNYVCAKAPCSAGDVFTVHVRAGGGNTRSWAFYDSDNALVQRSNANVEFNGQLTAPTNAAYVVFNNAVANLNDGYYAFKGKPFVYDSFPVEDSKYPVESGGLYDELWECREAIGQDGTEQETTADSGYYWNDETDTAVKTEYSGYKAYSAISVNPGEHYRVYGYFATSTKQHLGLVVDSNYKIMIRLGKTHQAYNDCYCTIPEGAAYILMTSNVSAICYKLNLNRAVTYAGGLNYNGKTVAIIGDSISTNGNYSASNRLGNVPEIFVETEDIGVQLSGYVTYYDVGTTIGGHTITESEVGTEITVTPVSGDEGKMIGKPLNNNSASVVTWWEVAQKVLGFDPVAVCWSGSSITSHEANDTEDGHYIYKTSYAWHPAQIRKCGVRTPGTMTRTAPDVIIIYRGTNDFSHSPYTRLTDYLTRYPFTIPETDAYTDNGTKYGFLEGLAITVNRLREAYPEAQIMVCTFNYFHRNSTTYPGFPSRNGINTIYQYNDAIREFANYFGCGLIEFDKDGITWANAASGAYYQEGTSTTANHTHPNTKGHKVLGNRALIDMQRENNMA